MPCALFLRHLKYSNLTNMKGTNGSLPYWNLHRTSFSIPQFHRHSLPSTLNQAKITFQKTAIGLKRCMTIEHTLHLNYDVRSNDTDTLTPESIECFIEGQTFSRRMIWLIAHAQPLPLPSASSTDDTKEDWESESTCWWKRVGKGWAWSRIIHVLPQKSLVLYKSINTLCLLFFPVSLFQSTYYI